MRSKTWQPCPRISYDPCSLRTRAVTRMTDASRSSTPSWSGRAERSLFGGGDRVRGTAAQRTAILTAFACSGLPAATIDTRRAETLGGSAAPRGAGERGLTNGRAPPNPLAKKLSS